MKQATVSLIRTVIYYERLLCRYGRFFLKDDDLVHLIVKEVLEEQHLFIGLLNSADLRQTLKVKVRERCMIYTDSILPPALVMAPQVIKKRKFALQFRRFFHGN